MSGEHPLDKKLREEKELAERSDSAAKTHQASMDAQAARTAAAWPEDQANLETAVKQCNEVLAKHGSKKVYKYVRQPQPSGDIARAHVQLHDAQSGSTALLDIRVTQQGTVVTTRRGIESTAQHVVGQMNVAAWNEVLTQLHS